MHEVYEAHGQAMGGSAATFEAYLAERTLLKRLLLAATFVIWAVDQLLPLGRFATLIGDVVIAAYVLDLFWLSQEQASTANPTPHSEDRST